MPVEWRIGFAVTLSEHLKGPHAAMPKSIHTLFCVCVGYPRQRKSPNKAIGVSAAYLWFCFCLVTLVFSHSCVRCLHLARARCAEPESRDITTFTHVIVRWFITWSFIKWLRASTKLLNCAARSPVWRSLYGGNGIAFPQRLTVVELAVFFGMLTTFHGHLIHYQWSPLLHS